MSTGTAKPTPSPPPPVERICELMPRTRPWASTSGPPELPWLIAASVWIAPSIWNAVSESIVRSSAEITPTDSDCGSPNGLPIAATGAPTVRWALEPSGSGVSFRPGGVHAQQRDVGVGVVADDLRRHLVAVAELDVDALGALDVRALAHRHDVRVGGDLAVVGDDEARAQASCVAAARSPTAPPSKTLTTVTTPGDSRW